MKRPNLRWPAKPGNGLAPWYVIAWRCVWWLPIMASLASAFLFITLASGLDAACEFWSNAT